jgi:hypothetical protein
MLHPVSSLTELSTLYLDNPRLGVPVITDPWSGSRNYTRCKPLVAVTRLTLTLIVTYLSLY